MARVWSMLLAGTLACLVGLSAARTQEKEKKKEPPKKVRMTVEEWFKKLDANNDKRLTLDEFKAVDWLKRAPEPQVKKLFQKLDANSDKAVSLDEFKALVKAMEALRKQGGTAGRKAPEKAPQKAPAKPPEKE